MSKPFKPAKTTVELRPSRIRREPPPPPEKASKIDAWRSSEREIWMALIGIVAFALAINVITLAIGAYWS